MNIPPIFCEIDDFCLIFESLWHRRLLQCRAIRGHKPKALALSEVMTILVLFHTSGYRGLKTFYTQYVQKHLLWAFPRLTNYNRFVELQREALVPLWCYLQTRFRLLHRRRLCGCHNSGCLP